jgi:hypothetical protein
MSKQSIENNFELIAVKRILDRQQRSFGGKKSAIRGDYSALELNKTPKKIGRLETGLA